MDRYKIRKHFSDFRYMSSSDGSNILREFVRYEDVVKMVNELEKQWKS